MSRFFFEIHDEVDLLDSEGVELPDLTAASRLAALALTEVAKDNLPMHGTAQEVAIAIRHSSGVVVRTCSLAFSTSSNTPGAVSTVNAADELALARSGISEGERQVTRQLIRIEQLRIRRQDLTEATA